MGNDDFEIIDPPVGPRSPRADIEAWIKELKGRKQTTDVKLCIEQAEAWLAISSPEVDTFYGPEKETRELERKLRRRSNPDDPE